MAVAYGSVVALLLASAARTCSASGFLSHADVDGSLELELDARDDRKLQIHTFEQALATSYKALPKNEAGNLQHQTARYILHRFFVQRHGWYIKGLEPNRDSFHTHASTDDLKDWVPSYMLEKMQKLVDHKGLDLKDLAVLAASIDFLARDEAAGLVHEIFEGWKEEHRDRAPAVQDAVLVYAASYLSGSVWGASAALKGKQGFIDTYTEWNRTRDWYKAIERAHLQKEAAGEEEEFVDGEDAAARIAVDIGERYGAFNDQQCGELKRALLGTWAKGNTTGRVRLADFYRLGLDTQWDLVEKKDYLRALGAIDESNASSPMVIVPNYLTSRPNCLEATNLYAVCCRNECEDLLEHLEREIGAPEAHPEAIMELIDPLKSDTVLAPRSEREIKSLAARLQAVANGHGGKVKLHGRLFAQWMHHAYPSECPYPHVAGAAGPSSPDQWLGQEIEASEEERRQMVEESCSAEEAAAEWVGELPWSHEDELLNDHKDPELAARLASSRKVLLALAILFVGVGTAVRLSARPGVLDKMAARLRSVSKKQAMLAALALFGVALDLVNWKLLLLMLCVGMLLPRLLGMGAQKNRVEKNVV